MASDIIFIQGLKVPTTIGVHAWETLVTQTLIVDVSMQVNNLSDIARTDDIEIAIDYQKVADSIQSYGKNNSHKLIESFANNLAIHIANNFNISSIEITVHKIQAIADAKHVGVKIVRNF